MYRNGKFVDFCRGPHVPSTGKIKAFKLTSIAGAYWLGDEKEPQLQRIYGTSVFHKKDLDQHLQRLKRPRNVTIVCWDSSSICSASRTWRDWD